MSPSTSNRRTAGAALLAALAAAPPAAAEPPAQSNLSQVIQALGQADTYDELVTVYARGCTLDRNSRRLHDTFIRRLLRFGQPLPAWHAATALTQLEPDNALAWGVLAYVEAARGRFDDALPAALKAAQLEPNNSAYNHNAAQLAVWYENLDDTSSVPAFVRPVIADLKTGLRGNKAFLTPYRQAQEAYGRVAEQQKAARREFEESRAAVVELDRDLRLLAREVTELEYLYLSLNAQVRGLVGQISRLDDQIAKVKPPSPEWTALTQQRNAVLGQLQGVRLEAARAWNQGRLAERERREKLARMSVAQGDVSRLEQAVLSLTSAMRRALTWRVPHVAGAPDPPAAPAPADVPEAPPPASRPAPDARRADDAAEAAAKLKLARLYLANDMPSHAGRLLREILKHYPAAPAAAEAKKLLAEQSAATTRPAPAPSP